VHFNVVNGLERFEGPEIDFAVGIGREEDIGTTVYKSI
jgi:hypothetical protein